MSEQFTPSVEHEVNQGPTLEQQAAEMGLEVDGAPAPAPETPELILGKFQSNEELAQAYQNLEQRLGQQSPDLSGPLTRASEYYAQNGQLDDGHYQALESVGINRQFVDSYIAGQQAQTQQTTQSWFDRVGGEANYQAMGEWMQTYLPESEINAYNRVMESGTDEEVGVLMSGMYARYQGAMNQNYQQMQGQTTPDAPLGFESRGQVMEALSDPRYEYDEAYRAEFEAKLAMTPENIF